MSVKLHKYSIVCEGKFDLRLIQVFKNEILNIKTVTYCREHSLCCHGCVKLNDVEKINNNDCCQQFIVFDQDKLSNEIINEFNEKLHKNIWKKVIISYPCIEIVLLAIFDVFEASYDKKLIEQKITKYSAKYKIDYNHSSTQYLSKIVNWILSDKKSKNKWIDNIKNLNKLKKSNFIDIINFFMEVQNGKM